MNHSGTAGRNASGEATSGETTGGKANGPEAGRRTWRSAALAVGGALAAGVLLFAPAQGTPAGEYLSGVPGAAPLFGTSEAHTGPGISPHEPGEGGCSCPACCGMEIDGITVSSSKAPGGADPSGAGEYVVEGG